MSFLAKKPVDKFPGFEVSDPVLSMLERCEKGYPCTLSLWNKMLRYAVDYDTCFSDPEDGERFVERFVAVQPEFEPKNVQKMYRGEVDNTWRRLNECLYTTPLPPETFIVLTERHAELTEQLVTHQNAPMGNSPGRWNLESVVDDFYQKVIDFDFYDLMGTVFQVQGVALMGLLVRVASHPALSGEVIEQYAWTVPSQVAAKFAGHRNCPPRLRTALTVSLPHLAVT